MLLLCTYYSANNVALIHTYSRLWVGIKSKLLLTHIQHNVCLRTSLLRQLVVDKNLKLWFHALLANLKNNQSHTGLGWTMLHCLNAGVIVINIIDKSNFSKLELELSEWNIFARYICSASWSSGNEFVFKAEDLKLKSQAGQIGHSVANDSPPLRHFFKRSSVARKQWRGDGPCQLATRFGVIRRALWKIWFDKSIRHSEHNDWNVSVILI